MSRTKLAMVIAVLATVVLTGSAFAVAVVSSSGWDASYPAINTVNNVFGTGDMGMASAGATVMYDLGTPKVIRKMRITPPQYGGSDPGTYNPVSGTVEFSDGGFNSVVYNWSSPPLESVGRTDYSECSFPDHEAYQYVTWTITSGGRVGEVWFIESPSIACWEMNQNASYTNSNPAWWTVDGIGADPANHGVISGDPGGWGEPYVTYDLGESKSVYGFKMQSRIWAGLNPQSGELWVSDDPVTGYQKVGDWTLPDMSNYQTMSVPVGNVVSGRYVQLRNLTVGDQWCEFDVLTTDGTSVIVDSSWGWDDISYPAANTVDGIFGTANMARALQQDAWIIFDLLSPRTVSKMRLYPPVYGGGSFVCNPQAGRLEFSNDKITWTTPIDWTLPPLESGGRVDFAETALPEPTTYRYVRFTVTSPVENDNRVAELVFVSSPTLAIWETNQYTAYTNDYPGWQTCDGDYWSWGSFGAFAGDPGGLGSGYLTYDLGKTKMVYGFAIKSRPWADCNPTSGSLWVSDDPVNGYVKIGDWTMPNMEGVITGTVNFSAAEAKPGRYVQLRDIDVLGTASWIETTILTPDFRPAEIPQSDSVTIDGDLSDWAGATWAPMDQVYNAVPSDIAEGYYSAKWGANGTKIYVAAKVRDTAHHFTDSFTYYSSRDAIEVYVHTTGTGPTDYSTDQSAAQQYAVGIKNSDHNSVWSTFGSGDPIPTNADFSADGSQVGDWLYYEVALTPFETFHISGTIAVVSPLSAGQVIGLDVAAVGYDPAIGYTGMVAENGLTQKWGNYGAFGLHTLTGASIVYGDLSDAKKAADGAGVGFTGSVTADFGDYIYVGTTDRSSGIRVNKAAHGVSPGQLVNVTGTMDTLDSMERCVVAGEVTPTGGNLTILPLGLNNKSLGGGDFGGQAGVVDGSGLNNIGLLVKAWGVLTNIGGNLYSLDDGSGVAVTVQILNGSVSGTPYAAVTGIMSCVKDGSDVKRRVIVKNAATDVQTF